MFRRSFLFVLTFFFVSTSSFAVVDPSSVKVKVFAMALSTNTDCSNPTVVFEDSAGREVDMLQAPEIGSGDASDNTYECIIMKMSDIIKFTPASTEGSCTAGSENILDVCQTGATTTNLDTGSATFNAAVNCTTSTTSEETVTLFLSTGATSTSGNLNSFVQPTSSSNGLRLNGAFTVSGSSAAEFVVNGNGKVDGSGATCQMEPPLFGFR